MEHGRRKQGQYRQDGDHRTAITMDQRQRNLGQHADPSRNHGQTP